MPRPADGYKNAAGQPVPGTTTIAKRYADKSGLIYWAHKEGLKGNHDLYATAADIGTAVHKMCELDLRGASEREIKAVPGQMLSTREDINKACNAFDSFREWRKEHQVRAVAFEESLVSEELQYGGTFDIIAWVDGQRSLLDFKTCKDASRCYLEQKVAMSAHANLWHEQHPDQPIEAYHLIMLPKDGSRPVAHRFADLDTEWHMFALQLECWKLENGISKKASLKRAAAAPAHKRATETVAAEAPAPKAEAKPKTAPMLYQIAAQPETAALIEEQQARTRIMQRNATMAELRGYGEVIVEDKPRRSARKK
jgi:hypothetical protein